MMQLTQFGAAFIHSEATSHVLQDYCVFVFVCLLVQ